MSSDNRNRYRDLYESQPDQRLYAAPWWLDAVCGTDGWNAAIADVLVDNEDKPVAIPFFKTTIRGLSAVITPPLTQWVDVIDSHALSSIYPLLVKQLPASSILDISLRPGIELLPPPRAFRISTQYSYILPALASAEAALARYNDTMRYTIRQAPDQLIIQKKPDIDLLLQLVASVFIQKQMKEPPWIQSVLPRLAKEVIARGCGEMRFAIQQNKVIAGSLVVWDDKHAYYLVGGREAGEKGQSAHAYLLHDAILSAGARGQDFDFEGSMIPGVASFFQSFGARPVPFVRLRRFRGRGLLWSLLK
jgi:hypothetical protein